MTRKGEKYECSECGVVVAVDKNCGCASCDLICCGVPMKEIKPKVAAKTKAKAETRK